MYGNTEARKFPWSRRIAEADSSLFNVFANVLQNEFVVAFFACAVVDDGNCAVCEECIRGSI